MPTVIVTETGTVEVTSAPAAVQVTVPVASAVQVRTGSTGPAGPIGPKGDKGDTGAAGADGVDGTDGADGTNGTNGTNGAAGAKGDKGDPGVDGTDGADGTNGSDGAPGADGADGVGVPVGGTTGQVLAKTSGTDFDTTWVDQSGGGGGILTITGDTEIAVDATDPDNIVLSIGASIARGSDVTTAIASEATLARNGDNITSGTVAEARIDSTIARDTEVTAAVAAEATARNAAIAASTGANDPLWSGAATGAMLINKATGPAKTQITGFVPSGDLTMALLWYNSLGNAVWSSLTDPVGAALAAIAPNKGSIIVGLSGGFVDKLNVGTNGQVLSANSATGTGLQWITAKTVATDVVWTAKGQIAAATASGAASVQTVGSNGQVLTADSTQTRGLKWATPLNIATDTTWANKGDLIVATANDTAAVLAVGSDGKVLVADSSQTTGLIWTDRRLLVANNQTADYTLVLSDLDKVVEMNKATAITLTIPANASVAFPVGTTIKVYNMGAGQVTVAITTDTLRAPNGAKLAKQYSMATLWKRDTTTWVISGDVTT